MKQQFLVFSILTASMFFSHQECWAENYFPLVEKHNLVNWENPAEMSTIPPSGASLLDKLFQKENANGEVVYEVPYPFDSLVARIYGFSKPRPGLLTRVRALQTEDQLLDFLNFDIFERNPQTRRSPEILIPFGRSLQRPREQGVVTNPLKDPRQLIHFGPTQPEPYLSSLGPIHSRIYCGHVEVLNQVECISYNSTAGRFEFQVIEDYAPNKSPKVFYVHRTKCIGCHRFGAPIFPRFSWLESTDNLLLESAMTFANYHKDMKSLIPLRDQFNKAIQQRISTKLDARRLRGRTRLTMPPNIRFLQKFHDEANREGIVPTAEQRAFTVKSGSFDFTVQRSSRLLRLNQEIYALCGTGEKSFQCRKILLQLYFIKKRLNNLERIDSPMEFYIGGVDPRRSGAGNGGFVRKKFEPPVDLVAQILQHLNWLEPVMDQAYSKLQGKFRFLTSIADRDPLASLILSQNITWSDIRQCINREGSQCDFKTIAAITSPEAIQTMVYSTNKLTWIANPRVPEKFPYIPKDRHWISHISVMLGHMDLLFYYLTRSASGEFVAKDDIDDFVSYFGPLDKAKSWDEAYSHMDSLTPMSLPEGPLQREKVLYGLYKSLDPKKAGSFLEIITRKTPTPVALPVKEIYVPDQEREPELHTIYKSCASCHGRGGEQEIPQFLFAQTAEELKGNLIIYAERIKYQVLTIKRMPFDRAMDDTTREDLVRYVDQLKVGRL